MLVRIVAKLVATFVHWTPLGWIDRVGGALCGVLIGALLVSVGLIAVSQAPHGEKVRDAYTRQPVGDVIYHVAPSVYQGVRKVLGGQADELWERVVELKDEAVDEAEKAADKAL